MRDRTPTDERTPMDAGFMVAILGLLAVCAIWGFYGFGWASLSAMGLISLGWWADHKGWVRF